MTYSAVATTPSQAVEPPAQPTLANNPMPSSSSINSRLSALSRIQQRPHHRHKRLGKYILGQTIGEGEFGKVKLAWAELDNGERRQFAIKLLRQDRLRGVDQAQRDKVNHEINALQACRHPHVIRLEDLLQNVHYIGIVLDYASGGDMFTHIYKHGRLEERTAQRLFAQLVSGVHYLHQKGIVHRDLKLENLLLDGSNRILISDFGFANSFRSSKGYTLMKTSCGSPCYAAPEVVNSDKNYDGRKVDVWSVGVILFTFLAGYLPFDDDPTNPDSEDIQKLYRYIATTPLKFPDWIGGEARDLLRRILVVDPERRAKMQDIMAHRWLTDHRSFLSITPAEHEGSAPWQRRSSTTSHRPMSSQPQQQSQPSQTPQVLQPQSQHAQHSASSSFSLARSASAAAAAAPRPSAGPAVGAQPRVVSTAARGTRAPVRSSSMTPGSVPLQNVKDMKRQSAQPAFAYGYNSSAQGHTYRSKAEEVPELGIATTPQRLAPQTKPRPISFQPKTDSSFELVNGSSLYMPKTSQPRVALNREVSKSGEMSRPLSYVAENEMSSNIPKYDMSQHDAAHAAAPADHSRSQSQSGHSAAHKYSGFYSSNSASTSKIPRSTSIHMKKDENSAPPVTPATQYNEFPAALAMQTPRKPDVMPPARRTSVRSSAHAAPTAREQPASVVRASAQRVPVQSGDYSEQTVSSSTPYIDQSHGAAPAIPPSRSKFRLSSALWPRKSSTASEQKPQAQQPQVQAPPVDRRASYVSTQSASQANAAAGAAVAANQRRQSGIPVKANKESSNLKKKTLNFFKRRSMIG